MKSNSYNIAIIGGGIVGCALGRELGKRFDKVLLIEKEASVGFHTSGRNSGVVHSGFNPQPGTLKAKLCVEGSKEVRQYCEEHHIPYEQVGTYVVALEEAEIPVLYDLKSRGEKNGVPGLDVLTSERVRDYEPNAKGIAALFSPTGAIVDSQALTRALAHDAQRLGVTLALGQEVMRFTERVDAVELFSKNDFWRVGLLINCAGLHADRLAHRMGVGRDYAIAPFRGEYFVVNRSEPPLIRSMIYPVPNPQVPFLGIHLTRTVRGSVLVGPNAVPAFGREAYSRWAVSIRDLGEMFSRKGTWNAFVRNRALVRIAWNEFRHACSRRHFLNEANRLVNGLCLKDLTLGNTAGIRPQLINSSGQLVEDLVMESTPRSLHILNVVSPGMTSAMPFARWLASGINDELQWKRVSV